jgi:predicted nucleic acid-binding protein
MKVVLDSNIYDKLAEDETSIRNIQSLIQAGDLKILVSPTIYEELWQSPFKGVPYLFPVTYIGESVLVAGGHVGDRCGKDEILQNHLGKSKKLNDAFIADFATMDADYLVTDDRRLKTRLNSIQSWCQSIDYVAFTVLLEQLSA